MFNNNLTTSEQTTAEKLFRIGEKYYQQQQYQSAAEHFEKAIKSKSHSGSLYYLGTMYQEGLFFQQDVNKATEYFAESARLGHSYAQNDIGVQSYKLGNYQNAFNWYMKSYQQRNNYATCNLANMYCYGHYVSKDLNVALFLYQCAMELGNQLANQYFDDLQKYIKKTINGSIAENVTIIPSAKLKKILDKHEQPVKLGKGGYASVYKVQYQHVTVAWKVETTPSQSLKKEVDIFNSLSEQHPNIVELYGATINSSGLYKGLILEFMSQGSLTNFLYNKAYPSNWTIYHDLITQLAQGIAFLHRQSPPVLHLDIKSDNVLLAKSADSDHYQLKITDFGMSAKMGEYACSGTIFWAAPEFFNQKGERIMIQPTKACDVYSFAIVLLEFAKRQRPYSISEEVVTQEVIKGKRPSFPEDTPQYIQQIAEASWVHDPQQRLSMVDVSYKLLEQEFNSFFEEDDKLGEVFLPPVTQEQLTTEQQNAGCKRKRGDSSLSNSLPTIWKSKKPKDGEQENLANKSVSSSEETQGVVANM